jgi:hypothetical protein
VPCVPQSVRLPACLSVSLSVCRCLRLFTVCASVCVFVQTNVLLSADSRQNFSNAPLNRRLQQLSATTCSACVGSGFGWCSSDNYGNGACWDGSPSFSGQSIFSLQPFNIFFFVCVFSCDAATGSVSHGTRQCGVLTTPCFVVLD